VTGPALREIHLAHAGKVSQKWSLFLDVYERVLAPRREDALRLVEIGVQNGGSLEIWAKYFPRAAAIVGCDIDPRCGALRFEDPRIRVVVGPVNAPDTARAILSLANPIDVFVDDGSHRSPDVILGFMNYFPFVRPGGVYLVEDLHCAYRPEYQGGIRAPNAVAFFRALVDVMQAEYWHEQAGVAEVLAPYVPAGAAPAAVQLAGQVASIAFHDSLCVIEKRGADGAGRLGQRLIAGQEAVVRPEVLSMGKRTAV
jgi:hypothetical protein